MKTVALLLSDCRVVNAGGRIRDRELLRELTSIGDVVVYAFHGATGTRTEIPGAKFHLLSTRRSLIAIAEAIAKGRMIQEARYGFDRSYAAMAADIETADVILVSQLYAASWLGRRRSALNASVIWDTQNYDPDVWALRSRNGGWLERLAARWEKQHVLRAMLLASSAADHILACSEDDAGKIRNRLNRDVTVAPNGADIARWASLPPGNPETLVAFGSLNQRSTEVGLARFLEDIWPSVSSEFPRLRLIVAGRDPSLTLRRKVDRALQAELVTDPPDMPSIVAQASVVVVPQAFGTGSKVKVLEAIASGRPVIGNSAAFVGLSDQQLQYVDIVASVDEWLAAIRRRVEPSTDVAAERLDAVSWENARSALRCVIRSRSVKP